MQKFGALFFILVVTSATLHAQRSGIGKDYSAQKAEAEATSFLEPYGYPLPQQVLDREDELKLTEEQAKHIVSIIDEMTEIARIKEVMMEYRTSELAGLFREKKAREPEVSLLVIDIERHRAELEGAILIASIRTRNILTAEQQKQFFSSQSSRTGKLPPGK